MVKIAARITIIGVVDKIFVALLAGIGFEVSFLINEVYLEPLLCHYRGNEFAVQYRQIMKSKLRKDIGWRQYPDESSESLIIDSVLSGMIETFITCLKTRAFPLNSAYRFASQSVDYGIAPAMKREFGISILPPEK